MIRDRLLACCLNRFAKTTQRNGPPMRKNRSCSFRMIAVAVASLMVVSVLVTPTPVEANRVSKKIAQAVKNLRKPPTTRPAGNVALRTKAAQSPRPTWVKPSARGVRSTERQPRIGVQRLPAPLGRPTGANAATTSYGRGSASNQWAAPIPPKPPAAAPSRSRGIASARSHIYGPAPRLNPRTHAYGKLPTTNQRNQIYGPSPLSRPDFQIYGRSPLANLNSGIYGPAPPPRVTTPIYDKVPPLSPDRQGYGRIPVGQLNASNYGRVPRSQISVYDKAPPPASSQYGVIPPPRATATPRANASEYWKPPPPKAGPRMPTYPPPPIPTAANAQTASGSVALTAQGRTIQAQRQAAGPSAAASSTKASQAYRPIPGG